ncbi:MAG: pyridoxal phosphate-dependent aminotransferase [Pseudomonadota bacterium]
MQEFLSQRIQKIQPSITLGLNAKAKELRAAGQDVISLASGEPDFATPANIQEAAIKAIRDGEHKYTAVEGSPALRQAIVAKLKRDNNLDYTINQVEASPGAKQAIYNLLVTLLNDGDEVIIPAPYWVSYLDMVLVTGGKPVIVSSDINQHYKITAAQLEQAITPKTKLLMLNSPSNPSGMVYSHEELKQLADVLTRHPHVLIMSDDIYEHILWSAQAFKNIVNVCSELYDRTIIINGVSKSYAMTGWRLGFAAGPEKIIAAMKKIQGQSTSCPCSITQAAAVEAWNGDQSCLQSFRAAYKQRHDLAYERFKKMPGVKIAPAEGAFYLFPDVSEAYQALGMANDAEFAEYLLEQAKIALVPGTAFGAPGSIRMSCALDQASLEKALDRFESALK